MLISHPRTMTHEGQPAQLVILRSNGDAWGRLILKDGREFDVDPIQPGNGHIEDDADVYDWADEDAMDACEEGIKAGRVAEIDPVLMSYIGWNDAAPEAQDEDEDEDEDKDEPVKPAGINCNTDLVNDLMTFSPYGPLSEVFVCVAIEQYAKQVAQASDAELVNQIIPADLWRRIASDVLARMNAFYSRHQQPVAQ